jgi:ligand-binding sensor domain-containing protein
MRAQQYFFKNFSVESGLPFVQVSCMYQDENGYLWSGGHGGLSRFDGKAFVNFNRKNGLVDHNVSAICTDSAGNVFVGTNKGLSILSGKKFTNITDFSGLANPSITSFCKGYHHSIYIGTTKGLFMYREGKVKKVKKLEKYQVNFLFNPDTTVIFIGTDKGLVLFGHNTFKVLTTNDGLASNNLTCVTRFRNSLVIGTSNGLSFLDLGTRAITSYYTQNGLIDENISAVANQHDSVLWVGAQAGLLRFDGKKWEYYNIRTDNNSNHIRCILNDREDNIWLGTHSGLFRYRDNSFSTYDKVPGLGNAFVYQILRDRSENLWVCTDNNGIFRQSDGYFRRLGPADGLNTNSSKAMHEDESGRLLFGTDLGLLQYTQNRFIQIPLPAEFKPPIEVIYRTRDNTVWMGGSNGFVSLRWKNGQPQTRFYGLGPNSGFGVFGFCEDEAANLYIGTFRGGLLKLKNDSITNLSQELKLNEETFFTLHYFSGRIFAASLNGVLVLNMSTNTLERINDEDGLNSELVYSIEATRDRRYLWIGTNQGINRLDLALYLSSGKIEINSFGKQEGFAGVECNSNGIWEENDGSLWFGTVNGLIRHQPFSYKKNLIPNKTLLQSIRLLNEDTLLINNSTLPSKLNTIAFYYRGICLTNPEKVLYQKKLEGLEQDKDWSAPTTENYIKYTNLAPGKYTFRVRSRNNEGIWDQEHVSFTFRISAPFYLTWWFILLTSVILFSVIYSIFLFRIYNIKKKQRKDFERKVEMSKIELKALRSQMNPHFVFNSLNAIQHYIFNTKSDEAIKYLNKFARLVRIILNNSDKPTVTVGEDIEALRLYLELEQMRFEEKFDYELIIEESVDPDYDIMPPLLMQPYVENAILHGLNPKPQKGKLVIRLYSEKNFLICTITDNGIGREKASEIRRTMPFRNHKSLGMKITEDRLKILNEINNSQLSVTITDLRDENGDALGTRVELYVPLTG